MKRRGNPPFLFFPVEREHTTRECSEKRIGGLTRPKRHYNDSMDKLEELFRLQAELNDKTFAKSPGTNRERGRILKMSDFSEACKRGDLSRGGLVDFWLQNYARALLQEIAELQDSTPWKWWSKDKQVNLQNARVEIIDALHFWLSLAMVAGMDADDVFRLYVLKNKVNHQRQDSDNYLHMEKDDSDNEAIQ